MINGEDEHYNVKVVPFTTQHGCNAVRFVGDVIPETDKGFKYYSDNDVLISDLSDYTHLYRENQYSVEADEIEYPAPNNTPAEPSALSLLSARVSQLANTVNQNTSDIHELDDALCEYSTDIDERVGLVEDALCEISEDTEEETEDGE